MSVELELKVLNGGSDEKSASPPPTNELDRALKRALPASLLSRSASAVPHEERLHALGDDVDVHQNHRFLHLAAAAHDGAHQAPQQQEFGDDEFVRWDLMLVFPSRDTGQYNRSESDKKLDRERRKKRYEIVAALQNAGLLFKLFYSSTKDEIFCKVSAYRGRLKIEAQRIEYLMQLPDEAPYHGAWTVYSNQPHVNELLPRRVVDTKSNRVSIFRQTDRLRLMYEILGAKIAQGGANLDLNKLLLDRYLVGSYALHDHDKLVDLQQRWASWANTFSTPPEDSIRNYFGETIGLYFSFLYCYTNTLLPLALVAGAIFIYETVSGNFDTYLIPILAVLTSIWSDVFLKVWSRKNMELSVRWGTVDYERSEVRPWISFPLSFTVAHLLDFFN